MLWQPAYLQGLGVKPNIADSIPALASPVFGLDMSVRTSVFSDTAGTVQAADGAAVARIANVYGGANHFLQSTANARPAVIANAAGTRAGLRFDPAVTRRWMTMAGSTNPGTLFQSRTFTAIFAYRRTVSDGYPSVFAAGNSAGGDGGNGYDTALLEGSISGPPRFWRRSGSENAVVQLTSPSYTNSVITKCIVRGAPANGMEIRAKSTAGSFTGTAALPSAADSFTWDVALIGSQCGYTGNPIPTDPMTGDIFEFRWWNTRATDAQMTQFASYLDNKWGA